MHTRSDDLEILLAVVDSGGFSAAAEALDIQVARVSRSVSKLEKQLGVSILNRTTRRVELTDEGRQFVEAVRIGLQQIQQAEEDLIARGELPRGRLRVDAASPFIQAFTPLLPRGRVMLWRAHLFRCLNLIHCQKSRANMVFREKRVW